MTSKERDALFRDNMGLVERAARAISRRLPRHVDYEGILAAALVGLWEAAQSFDATRSSFNTHAYRKMRFSVADWLRAENHPRRKVQMKRRSLPSEVLDTSLPDARELLAMLCAGLPIRERTVANLRYGQDWTQDRVGRALGVGGTRVSQIDASIREHMAARLEAFR